MRRAVISVASNIAEGSARKRKQEKIQFYSIARASLSELDAHVDISLRLKFVGKDEYNKTQIKIDEVSRMLQGLINSYEIP
jgi:four helix bundle protein